MKKLLLIAMVLAACSKANKGPTSRDGVIAAWKKGGLEPSAFTAVQQPDLGKDCASGTVNKLDVLVCTYTTPELAKAAEDAGLKWVGDTTGASRAQGDTLIVVADRKKADPSGKTINQIVTLPAK